MKKLIILILLLSGSVIVNGQNYVPLIDSLRTWDVATFPGDSGGSTTTFLYGDTVLIQDTLYVEVLEKEYGNENENSSVKAYLREDIITKKVYHRDALSENPTLLYDFSLEEGDSIKLLGIDFLEYTVENVDSVEIHNGTYRKRWSLKIENSENIIWIEGIGNITGYLLNSGQELFQEYLILLCCHEDQDLIYLNELYNTCNLITPNVGKINQPTINYYPNPANDYIYFSSEFGDFFEITIFNLQGQILYKQEVENNERIDISYFHPGTLFFQVTTINNKKSNFKIIKL